MMNSSRNVKEIGVWIEAPGDTFRVGEGIVRVVVKLLEAWKGQGRRISVACSDDCAKALSQLMGDIGAGTEGIRFVTVKERSALQKLNEAFARFLAKRVHNQVEGLRHTQRLYYTFMKFLLFRYRGDRHYKRPSVKDLVVSGFKAVFRVIYLAGLALFSALNRRAGRSFLTAYDFRHGLLRRAKRLRLDAWYVPRPDWGLAAGLKPRVIWAFWDLIPIEAPLHFPVDSILARVRRAVREGGEFVTMSNYVKEKHAVKTMGLRAESVRVLQPPFHRGLKDVSREEAVARVRGYLRALPRSGPDALRNRYLCDLPFERIDYLFFPSQIREYKNFFNLVLALEKLVREGRRDLKLVTTGSLATGAAADVCKYLVARGLVFDVISLPELPSPVLHSFMTLAKLTVCPSFAEGGFPPSFLESVALGTPTVAARMPNLREFIDWRDGDAAVYTFEPFSVDGMTKAIADALDRREVVLEAQKSLIARGFAYDWGDYARFVLGETAKA